MFDKQSSKSERTTSVQSDALAKHYDLITLYFAVVLPLLRQGSIDDPGVQTACRLFMLGVVDMISQANHLDSSQFLALLQAALAEHQLTPQSSIESFVELAGQAARKFDVVDQIIREGANSIRDYVTNRHADASADLLRVAIHAEKNAHQLEAAMSTMVPMVLKKPSEEELERAVLYASMLARANERDNSRLSTKDEIATYLDLAFAELKANPDQQQQQLAQMSAQGLLMEHDFIEEVLEFRISNPGAALPIHFRDKMLAALEKAVTEFMRDHQT